MGTYDQNGQALYGLIAEAFAAAKRLESREVGPIHFLIALLRVAQDPLASSLRDCSITMRRVTAYAKRAYATLKQEHEPILNPFSYRLLGLAEGLAAGDGSNEVRDEHVAIAILWNPYSSHIFDALGKTRDEVKGCLEAAGIRVPDLPPTDETVWGPPETVPIENLGVLQRELPLIMPAGAELAFQIDEDQTRAWLWASAGLQLDEYITRVLVRREKSSSQ
jgi:hypothetical protein